MNLNAIQIARRLAELNQIDDARQAYTVALDQGLPPEEELEAALYIFQSGGDYRRTYTSCRNLYNAGHFKNDLISFLTEAFYTPNKALLKSRYEKNCRLLSKYPYIFRTDFLPFEELSVRFYPFDDNGHVPFYVKEERFGDYINVNHPVVSRNFFRDLEKPILAGDVFSQYELEYLNDNVRRSEDIGRENHIYLHYTSWEIFCSFLQVLSLRELLTDKKLVFLMEEELKQYPIDFKVRFGLDYSQYPTKVIDIREVHRLIWHTQLAAHNGGDFFNEIFDGHPNLVVLHSQMMNTIERSLSETRALVEGKLKIDADSIVSEKNAMLIKQLFQISNPTDKDLFVALCIGIADCRHLDMNARIVPAIFFQPHFSNIYYSCSGVMGGAVTIDSPQYQAIQNSPVFQDFRYIKTFTPIRRPTTSSAATVRFMYNGVMEKPEQFISDVLAERLLNRSFMVDWQDRLFRDSVMVRFEDGKLNPKATFTALAAFLDLPYTESLSHCSMNGEIDPVIVMNNIPSAIGFDLSSVYRTYEDYMGGVERYLLEYSMKDLYEHCGYQFQWYDGAHMTMERIEELVNTCSVLDDHIQKSVESALIYRVRKRHGVKETEEYRQLAKRTAEKELNSMRKNRLEIMEKLFSGLYYVNKNGQPLHMMPMLKLDPELLEQPLYH